MSGGNMVVKAKGKHGSTKAPPRPTSKSGRRADGIPAPSTSQRLSQR